jgi:NAD(P)-dependent dehydrogenase (short-subunit alcohol dehydrogenase family)
MTRIAIVTGAGSGIGKAAALALLADGWRVALAGRRRERLDAVARESGAGERASNEGARALAIAADVTREEQVGALFAQVLATWGRIDLLFNNAGIFQRGMPIEDLSLADWQTGVDVNLTGVFLCMREAFRAMKAQTPRGGRIINNGSLAAQVPRPNSSTYTATKHAITGLTRCGSLDGRKYDIAVSQIDIGNAATDMTEVVLQGVPQADGRVAIEPRFDAAHVGEAVRYIANLPLDANVQFMSLMATKMPYIGRG